MAGDCCCYWLLATGNWKLETGSWKLEAGNWQVSDLQLSRVHRHPYDRVDVHPIELVNLLACGDAACRCERPGCRRAERADRVHIGALHQPLEVDVGVEELAEKGF